MSIGRRRKIRAIKLLHRRRSAYCRSEASGGGRGDSELKFLRWVDEEVECCWSLDGNMESEGDVEEADHGLTSARKSVCVVVAQIAAQQ